MLYIDKTSLPSSLYTEYNTLIEYVQINSSSFADRTLPEFPNDGRRRWSSCFEVIWVIYWWRGKASSPSRNFKAVQTAENWGKIHGSLYGWIPWKSPLRTLWKINWMNSSESWALKEQAEIEVLPEKWRNIIVDFDSWNLSTCEDIRGFYSVKYIFYFRKTRRNKARRQSGQSDQYKWFMH